MSQYIYGFFFFGRSPLPNGQHNLVCSAQKPLPAVNSKRTLHVWTKTPQKKTAGNLPNPSDHLWLKITPTKEPDHKATKANTLSARQSTKTWRAATPDHGRDP